jgi:hypothetical protein
MPDTGDRTAIETVLHHQQLMSYFEPEDEIVFEAVGISKSGSDLPTLWTTPHISGIRTIIQETAMLSGEDFLS